MKSLRKFFLLACVFLMACSGGLHDNADPIAQTASFVVVEQIPGTTPFIGRVIVSVDHYDDLASVAYTIAPKPGTFSKPVSVTYDKAWLDRNASYNRIAQLLGIYVFGLYSGYQNAVDVTVKYRDGSARTDRMTLQTAAYSGSGSGYTTPSIRTPRGPASSPVVDYILLGNPSMAPVVIDSDGNLRWVGNDAVTSSTSTLFSGDRLYVGSKAAPVLYQLLLDGTFTSNPLASSRYTDFHHELAPGKLGMLAELDVVDNGVSNFEAVLAEITPDGQVLKEWDMAAILGGYMRAHGDDPSNFVRYGSDWFHMNSAIYDPADDTLLVSSRENFVIKIGYETGEIKWIFGDPTKHWYVDYPSLRALALTTTVGKPPIGQHALSITPNGDLLLFNNGWGSENQPARTSPGITRASSTPSRYHIDEPSKTAREVWTYEHQPPLFTDICSSVYETTPGSYLILYASVDKRQTAVLTALDAAGKVAFEYAYPSYLCGAAFKAQPIAFESLLLK
jgi:hypothetical protein